MLLAQSVVTGIALNAFIALDSGSLQHRIDVDRTHWAHICTIAASHALVWIDFHWVVPASRVSAAHAASDEIVISSMLPNSIWRPSGNGNRPQWKDAGPATSDRSGLSNSDRRLW